VYGICIWVNSQKAFFLATKLLDASTGPRDSSAGRSSDAAVATVGKDGRSHQQSGSLLCSYSLVVVCYRRVVGSGRSVGA
jgi:hypothetical protein